MPPGRAPFERCRTKRESQSGQHESARLRPARCAPLVLLDVGRDSAMVMQVAKDVDVQFALPAFSVFCDSCNTDNLSQMAV